MTGSSEKQAGWLLDVNYSSPNQQFNVMFDPSKVISGKAMLLWQALAQIRLFITLDPSKQLPNEAAVLLAMSAAL
jgi:shikimate 5-dehydrogenase